MQVPQGDGHVMGENFLNMTIDSIGPVKLLVWKSGKIRLFGAKADGGVPHLDKV